MSINNEKQKAKYERYLRILKVCKGRLISCDVISDLVYGNAKSILHDTKILTKFGFLKETRFKVMKFGRPTKHYATLIETLDAESFEKMKHESAAYWQAVKRTNEQYTRKVKKQPEQVTTVKNEAFDPLYQLLGLVAHGEFKPLPNELITVYDINANKEKVNESIRYDVRKSPKAYAGTSAGMVW